MKGHVILSHGLESSPQATKVSAMAQAAEALGWSTERPDYSDLDARREIGAVPLRLQRLLERCAAAPAPLVLAGSSMGAYISALATLEVRCAGLFLLAPPVRIDGVQRALNAAQLPTMVIHGWADEVCPVGDAIRWSQRRRDRLILLDDGHRLENSVQFCAAEFARFLDTLS